MFKPSAENHETLPKNFDDFSVEQYPFFGVTCSLFVNNVIHLFISSLTECFDRLASKVFKLNSRLDPRNFRESRVECPDTRIEVGWSVNLPWNSTVYSLYTIQNLGVVCEQGAYRING